MELEDRLPVGSLVKPGQDALVGSVAEQVNIYDAKTNLSKLIERVESGEEIVIARNGRPVAHLVPVQRRRRRRTPGALRGRIRMSDGTDPHPEGDHDTLHRSREAAA